MVNDAGDAASRRHLLHHEANTSQPETLQTASLHTAAINNLRPTGHPRSERTAGCLFINT